MEDTFNFGAHLFFWPYICVGVQGKGGISVVVIQLAGPQT